MKEPLIVDVLSHDVHWAIYEMSARHIESQLGLIDRADHHQRYTALKASVEETEALGTEISARIPDGRADGKPYSMFRGIAQIAINGLLMKALGPSVTGTSTVEARRLIRAAASDPEVKGILISFDSPGGSVSGTEELASDIAAASAKKPTVGVAAGICASAAYWAFSQCRQCFAVDKTTVLGSIGIITAIQDESERYAKAGVKVHVIATGDLKGTGHPGSEVTDEQIAAVKHIVNGMRDVFVKAVARGRGMDVEDVLALTDGNVWLAEEAVEAGLVDAIASYDDILLSMTNTRSPAFGASAEADNFAQGAPLIGVPIARALESVRIAAEGLAQGAETVANLRLADIRDRRANQQRAFSPSTLKDAKDTLATLTGAVDTFSAVIDSCEALADDRQPPATHDRQAVDAAVSRALSDAAVCMALTQ